MPATDETDGLPGAARRAPTMPRMPCCCSMSTSTATTEPTSGRVTRPAGPALRDCFRCSSAVSAARDCEPAAAAPSRARPQASRWGGAMIRWPDLEPVLTEAAWAARHEGYLKSRDHRQLMTSGGSRSTAAKNQEIIVALRAILVIIRQVLATGTPTTDSAAPRIVGSMGSAATLRRIRTVRAAGVGWSASRPALTGSDGARRSMARTRPRSGPTPRSCTTANECDEAFTPPELCDCQPAAPWPTACTSACSCRACSSWWVAGLRSNTTFSRFR